MLLVGAALDMAIGVAFLRPPHQPASGGGFPLAAAAAMAAVVVRGVGRASASGWTGTS